MFSGKFLAIIVSVLAIAVNGSPVEVAERDLQARGIGSVYFCIHDDFGEPCTSFAVDSGVCYNVPADYNDEISSFRPDSGVSCTLYEDYYCGGSSLYLTYPGSNELAKYGFNDITSSFSCT